MRSLLAVLFTVGVAGKGSGQEVTRVDGVPLCDCEVVLDHVVDLGDLDGPGALPGMTRAVHRAKNGDYFVLTWNEYEVVRFDHRGEVLPPLGKEGEGPGEAQDVAALWFLGDSIVTFDRKLFRMTVYASDLSVVRTAPVQGSMRDVTRIEGVGFVVAGRFHTAIGVPLHLIRDDGTYVRAFGGEEMDLLDPIAVWIRSVAAREGRVWSAPENSYRLEEWTPEGVHVRTLERVEPWFPPKLVREWGGPDEPIDPWVIDIAVDDGGYIRTAIVRASRHWADRLPEPRPRRGGTVIYPIPPGIGLFEARIEIIDPMAGRLIASGEFELEVFGFADAEHVFSYSEDEIGNPKISIWRIRLSR